MTDASVPSDIEIFDVALKSYFLTPANDPKLTVHDEVQEAIRGLKICKAPNRMVSQKGLEASSPTSVFPPGPDRQCGFPRPSLSPNVEACLSDLYS